MDRNKMQEAIADKFCTLANKKALIVVSTGAGKARIAILVIQKLNPKKVLILTESTVNRDITFKQEIKKWDKSIIKKTKFMTYQLAYKMTKDLSDYLIIADEADFAFTHAYGKVFKTYKDIPTLAMTGYVTPEKYDEFKQYLPRIEEITAENLQGHNILNKVKFIFVQFCLSKEKTFEVKYKKGNVEKSFKQSEDGMYNYYQKQERKWRALLLTAETKGDTPGVKTAEYMLFKKIPSQRKELLYRLESSVGIVRKLMDDILQEEHNKVITFSERTAQADKLSKYPYHGKIDDAKATKRFKQFQKGTIRELATCSKINRGVNVEGLNFAILESFNSSVTTTIQKRGRLMRLDPEEIATFYIMMPYYTNTEGAIKPTRAVSWARKIFQTVTYDEHEVLNYCSRNVTK